MTELQNLITREMLKRGGGIIPIDITSAAHQIGITQPALTRILQGDRQPNPRTAILIARWLHYPIPNMLSLCGHPDLINLLSIALPVPLPTTHQHYLQRFADLIAPHTPATIEAALTAAAAVLSIASPEPAK